MLNVLLVVGTVVVLAGIVLVVSDNHAPSHADRGRLARTSSQPRTSSVPRGSATPESVISSGSAPATPKPVVAYLGDDWTAGTGASDRAKRFTSLLSRSLHVVEKNFGVNGTGYAKTTSGATDFSGRVAGVVAAHPDLVVVSGGRNDTANYLATVAGDARALFAELHKKLPSATLVAVAPLWGDSDEPSALETIGKGVKDAVTAVGGTYLDLPDPIHGHPDFMADDADPNDKGYAAIAAALRPKLKPLLASA